MKTFENIVSKKSENADLVIMGFSLDKITYQKREYFRMFLGVKDLLFIRADQRILISEVWEKKYMLFNYFI